MVLDILVLILGILAFVRGWFKGLLWAVCSFLAVLLAIILALKLSSSLSDFLFNHQWMNSEYTMPISFVLIFLLTIFIFRLGIKFIEKILDKLFLGWVNKLLGGLLYTGFVWFLLSTCIWLFNQVDLLKAEFKTSSKSYVYLKDLAPNTLEFISPYLPYCKNLIQEAKEQIDRATTLN